MTSQQLTALALKILGIWLLVNVVLYLPSIAVLVTNLNSLNDTPIAEYLSIKVALGFLAVGLLVSIAMLRVSKSVLSSVPESKDQNILTPTVALQITGLFFIVSALAYLPGHLLDLAYRNEIPLSTYGFFGGYVFKISVGVYLLVKPSLWVDWLNKLRGRG